MAEERLASDESKDEFVQPKGPLDFESIRYLNPPRSVELYSTPINIAQSNIVGQRGTRQDLTFQGVKNAVNYGESEFRGLFTYVPNNAGTPLANFYAEEPPIFGIVVTIGGGTQLVQATHLMRQRALRLLKKNMREWQILTARDVSHPNRALATSNQALDVQGAANAGAAIDYYEPKYLSSTAPGVAFTRPFAWKLKDLCPEWFTDLPCEMQFLDDLQITITIEDEQFCTWAATSQNDAQAGAVPQPAALGSYTLTKCCIVWKAENQPERKKELQAKFKPPYKLSVPYTITRVPRAFQINETSFSIDVMLQSGDGQDVQYIRWAIQDAAQVVSSAGNPLDSNNLDGRILASYQTFINGDPVQPNILYCSDQSAQADNKRVSYGDYLWNRETAGDSPLMQDRRVFQRTFCHTDILNGRAPNGKESPLVDRSMILGGVNLAANSSNNVFKYTVTGTLGPLATTRALQLYVWATCRKTGLWTESGTLLK